MLENYLFKWTFNRTRQNLKGGDDSLRHFNFKVWCCHLQSSRGVCTLSVKLLPSSLFTDTTTFYSHSLLNSLHSCTLSKLYNFACVIQICFAITSSIWFNFMFDKLSFILYIRMNVYLYIHTYITFENNVFF